MACGANGAFTHNVPGLGFHSSGNVRNTFFGFGLISHCFTSGTNHSENVTQL